MPSLRCQSGRTIAAQLKIRIFGYVLQAATSALFHDCMFASDHGPPLRSVCVLTHMTGSPCAADIISWIRAVRPTFELTATLAVSLVPSAKTQQPLNPPENQAVATR